MIANAAAQQCALAAEGEEDPSPFVMRPLFLPSLLSLLIPLSVESDRLILTARTPTPGN